MMDYRIEHLPAQDKLVGQTRVVFFEAYEARAKVRHGEGVVRSFAPGTATRITGRPLITRAT